MNLNQSLSLEFQTILFGNNFLRYGAQQAISHRISPRDYFKNLSPASVVSTITLVMTGKISGIPGYDRLSNTQVVTNYNCGTSLANPIKGNTPHRTISAEGYREQRYINSAEIDLFRALTTFHHRRAARRECTAPEVLHAQLKAPQETHHP
ncbi:MAG: hypothetical protein AAFW83_04855 [Pseudomonadota bacterium]